MGRYIKSLKLPHKRGGWVRAVKRLGDIRLTLISVCFSLLLFLLHI